MTYYPTLAEDLARAREILARGREENFFSGAIYGADIFAAFKLLESFVQEIEEHQQSFALYHNASMALMHAYKRAHPDVPELVWPDATKVNEWAAAEIERLRLERDSAREQFDRHVEWTADKDDERLLNLFRQLPTADLKAYRRALELDLRDTKDETILFATRRLKLIARVLEERPA